MQYILYLIILTVLAIPLGGYIAKVMGGERIWLTRFIKPVEGCIYKLLGIKEDEEMDAKEYTKSVLSFSLISLIVVFLIQLMQRYLPGNPQKLSGVRWDLAFNTAVSFITNTNWQAYSGEAVMSYFTQALALTVQNFASSAVGIAVLFALIRGLVQLETKVIGNFWKDITRIVLYLLIPINLVLGLSLIGGGVVQTWKPAEIISLQEPIMIDGELITEQIIPLGPAASQVAIKQTGTNGGGFYGTNSAHPLENPSAFTNLLQMISILWIPAALCFTFGKKAKDMKQGRAIFTAMFLCLALALFCIAYSEQNATTALMQTGMVDVGTYQQAGGNMEGKESRFGIEASATWAAFTTAASSGSVNSMHDSYTPLGGMVTMILMQLGEVIFGGTGCGLYGMLAFVILTVFVAGLMVGRTPEFMGKRIEPYEMKWAVCICMATPVAILAGSGIAALLPQIEESISNSGAHGFSQLLYAYSSAGGNNGSAFAGFGANTIFLNISLGIVMLFARFVPVIGTLAIAGSLSKKKKVAASAGTLSTSNALFVGLLIFMIVLVGALSFLPALALGPIAELLQSTF